MRYFCQRLYDDVNRVVRKIFSLRKRIDWMFGETSDGRVGDALRHKNTVVLRHKGNRCPRDKREEMLLKKLSSGSRDRDIKHNIIRCFGNGDFKRVVRGPSAVAHR